MTTMSVEKLNDERIAAHTDAYYEELASQEELYLEETEEEVRLILTSYQPSPSRSDNAIVMQLCEERESDLEVTRSTTDSLHELLVEAADELITGDSDDPPLRDEAVGEMVRVAQMRVARTAL